MTMKTIRATNLRKILYETLATLKRNREPIEIVLGGRPVAVLVPSPVLDPRRRKPLVDLDAVAAFCKKHKVKSFALFGSILREDFDAKSDVDVLVDFDRHIDFHEECRMIDDLEAMFGRKVDMIERGSLDRLNARRRDSIKSSARTIYEEASDEAA